MKKLYLDIDDIKHIIKSTQNEEVRQFYINYLKLVKKTLNKGLNESMKKGGR